ncbi:MAG: tRNA lysidine(34) synthetase TilS, partial [Candidatus Omnitrophica bacterium]|nr:tRNA lysidine(34) synthetase TilS [Candidatus Omnitrophota bacterium]
MSGGPDSVCLFYLFYQLRKYWDLELHVCHLNHKLRGRESDDDASFVKNLAERFEVPFHYGEKDIRQEAKKRGLSEEEGARLFRYEFFSQIAGENGIRKVALGHTRDDQIETFLMRLVKGAGLLGLRGIPPVREEKNFIIIRPLFETWRGEIIEYLEAEKRDYRIDKTNLTSIYLRNRIRNELIPYLEEKFNPKIKEILANTTENLGLAYEYINKQGKRKFSSVVKMEEGKVFIGLDKFKTFHPVIQREIFRLTIKAVSY